MTLYSYVKRRTYKLLPLFKKVIIPIVVIFAILHIFSNGSSSKVDIEENLILPGEALDPIARKPNDIIGQRNRESIKAKSTLEKPKLSGNEFGGPKPQLMMEEVPPIKRRFVEKDIHQQDEQRALPVPPNSKMVSKEEKKKTSFDDSDVPPRIKTEWSMAKANIPDAHKVKFRGHAITNDTVTLTLLSSSDKVFMSLNKREIYRSIGMRGMHVVVLNQYSGRVMAKRVFDTYMKGVEEDMVNFLDDIVDGRIVVFSVLDEAATGLTWKGRNALKEMGCRFSEKIAYRDMWAMATRKGGLKIAETYSNVATADTGYEWGGPIFMRTDFDLEEEPVECKWSYNERNQARRQFCLRYEGYGAMCRCDVGQWNDAFFKVNENVHNQLSKNHMYDQLGVVIIATNRPHNLYRTLKSLYEAPGLNKKLLAIYTEQATREVVALAKLFGVTIVESGLFNGTTPKKIRHKVQRIFRDVVGATFNSDSIPEGSLPSDTIPPFSVSNLLLLEEDIEVSIDIFKYFHSIGQILNVDKSVLAVSAFNYNGFREVSSSQTTSYRTNDPSGLALMLPSRTIKEILAPKWPTLNSNDDWWNAFYDAMDNNKADIVYPEVSRAKHSSFQGYMIQGAAQLDNFKDHVLSMTTEYEIAKEDVTGLQKNTYESAVEETIRSSKKIVFDFCKHELIYGQEPNVMFVTYDGKDDAHLRYVLKCLNAWSLYPAGGWRNVWQFHFHGHLLTIVGTPSSPFSKLKALDEPAVTAPPEAFTTTTTPAPSRAAKE